VFFWFLERQLDVQGVFQCLRVEVSKVKAATENVGNYVPAKLPQISAKLPQISAKLPQISAKIRKSQNDGELTFSDSQGLWMAPLGGVAL